MPHGTPDWGLVGPKTTTYGLDDLGEHAVRLGSPHLWDRRGDVVWLTDFRDGLGDVERVVAGVGAGVCLHTGWARQGAFCAQTTYPDAAGTWAFLRKGVPFPRGSGLGLEASAAWDVNLENFTLSLYGNDGIHPFLAGFRYNYAAPTACEYVNAAGLWTPLPPAFMAAAAYGTPKTLKMTMDFVQGRYLRFQMNEREWDGGAYAYQYAGAPGTPDLYATVAGHPEAAKTAIVYIDSIIVTQNEP